MIGVILKIVLICTLILLVAMLAGAVALVFFTAIDIISEMIRGWRKNETD